jgi:hypothetical protein
VLLLLLLLLLLNLQAAANLANRILRLAQLKKSGSHKQMGQFQFCMILHS